MELNDLYPAVLTIVLIGLVLGIGLFVMAEVREQIAVEYTGTNNSINITATDPTNTTTLTPYSVLDDYELLEVSIIYSNGSSATITEEADYNFTSGGVISWGPGMVIVVDNLVNISSTYIYDVSNSPEEAVNDSLEGLADFAGWIAVIVVVLAAAIVLGIVLRSFGQGRAA